MQIRCVTTSDIPSWQALSSEYDCYVKELVSDLKEWYGGNDETLAFTTYMELKVAIQEAFMAIDSDNRCLGIVAFSRKNNRITFFGVSHQTDLLSVGKALLLHAFNHLDTLRDICIQEITSQFEWIEQHRKLFSCLGFALVGDSVENGVPVNVFQKSLKNC